MVVVYQKGDLEKEKNVVIRNDLKKWNSAKPWLNTKMLESHSKETVWCMQPEKIVIIANMTIMTSKIIKIYITSSDTKILKIRQKTLKKYTGKWSTMEENPPKKYK